MKHTLKLAQKLDFTQEVEYFDYLINSYYNGQFTQCRNLFFKMKPSGRLDFFKYLRGCYDDPQCKGVWTFYNDITINGR